MKKKNGFTLVELLAVIVILAIIMIIAIPAVLETMQSARKKTFKEYAMKMTNEGQKTYLADQLTTNPGSCVLYRIKTDLGLNNTGDYKGYVVVKNLNDKQKVYVTLYDDEYMIYGVEQNYLENAELQRYSSSDKLSEKNLLSVANCSSYTVKTTTTYETKTETLNPTPESSTPEVKKLFTGEKEGEFGWVGVYENGNITECYNIEGDIASDGNPANNGTKSNYCTGKTATGNDSACLAAKSTDCCTGVADASGPEYYVYTYFYNENQSNDNDHTACGLHFRKSAPGFPNGTWSGDFLPGGGLAATGVYEE